MLNANNNNTDYTLTALQKEEIINPFNVWFPSMKPAVESVLCSLLIEHSWNFRTAKSRKSNQRYFIWRYLIF